MTQINYDEEGKPSNAAFKNYQTEFLRDVANLKNENGSRGAVSRRIAKAVEGLVYHLPAAEQTQLTTLLGHVTKFVNEVHNPILNSYSVSLNETPLAVYYPHLTTLYKQIILARQVVAAN